MIIEQAGSIILRREFINKKEEFKSKEGITRDIIVSKIKRYIIQDGETLIGTFKEENIAKECFLRECLRKKTSDPLRKIGL